MNDEARLFVRMAAFGLIVGTGYGLLTREAAGSVLLLAFGIASALVAVAIIVSGRSGRREAGAAAEPQDQATNPGWAPLEVGIGLGGLALGAAFGPWLAIGGLLVVLVGARGWLDAVDGAADAARRSSLPGPGSRGSRPPDVDEA
jgi:uncharacterized membrane protein YfcA